MDERFRLVQRQALAGAWGISLAAMVAMRY